ncbi:RNA-binding protein 45-like [Limulus polyphemus]|uniref:RNA-binding protein 45-like n=1 Tax=Limulus polyphemus TaxID=6850 RepID=A0ABM1BG13_LIMPO|nr:RNA-binding protein 45-like [Limulus polyphemus]
MANYSGYWRGYNGGYGDNISNFRSSDKDKRDRHDGAPPHSRLFILCDKQTTEEEIREAFEKFGNIEDIWVVKDRATNKPKGVTYVRFSKTSEAALAMETMDGQRLRKYHMPMKVRIAHNREDGSRKEPNEEERVLRLFVMVPKTYTEDDLKKDFEQYGELDRVNIVRDHSTGESKGFGYVKYLKMSSAANAFENCPKTFKAKFADPKPSSHSQRDRNVPQGMGAWGFDGSQGAPPPPPPQTGPLMRQYPGMLNTGYDNTPRIPTKSDDMLRVNVAVPQTASYEQLYHLFDLIPGLERCDVNVGLASLKFNNSEAATWARQKICRIEYPPGFLLQIIDIPSGGGMKADPALASAPAGQLTNHIASLMEKISEATNVLKNVGFHVNNSAGIAQTNGNSMQEPGGLPPPQPMAKPGSEMKERLFIVMPDRLPTKMLENLFCRFGNLMEIYLLPGKNCGFAKFSDKQSALQAMQTLHGFEIAGGRIRIDIANPEKGDRDKKRSLQQDDGDTFTKQSRNDSA